VPSSAVQMCARYGDYRGGGGLRMYRRSYAATCVRVGGVGRKRISIRSEKRAGGRAGGRPRATQWGREDAPEARALAGVPPNMSGAAAGVAVLPVDGDGPKMNRSVAGAFAAPAAYVYNYMYIYVYTSAYSYIYMNGQLQAQTPLRQ
jgi:hypothetical protein